MAEENRDPNDAPPSYNDVLATPHDQPVLSTRESAFIADPIGHHDNNRQSGYLVSPQPVTSPVTLPVSQGSTTDRLPPARSSSTSLTVVERYAAFNSIRYMSRHWGVLRKSPDADLDIEHHIPSSRAMLDDSKKAYGRIYCYRLIFLALVLLLIGIAMVLPVVMVLVGALNFDECPYENRVILYCLVIGGIVLGMLTCIRFTMCCLFFLGSDRRKEKNACTTCLCCMEMLFILVVIGYIAIVAVSAYFTFNDPPDESCPDSDPDCDDFCSSTVKQLSTVLILIQFGLPFLFLLTLCVLLLGVHRCCCLPQQKFRVS